MTSESEFRKLIATLDAHLDTLLRQFRAVEVGPSELFHYTTGQGLRGIVEENKLWASNVNFLNDLSEPTFAFEVIEKRIKVEYPELAATSNVTRNRLEVYAFSMCGVPDLLSQWRAYGAHGDGFAIGFSRESLCRSLRTSIIQYLVPVRYGRTEADTHLDEELNQLSGALAEAILAAPRDILSRERLTALAERLTSVIPFEIIRWQATFKNEAFAEEREWRLVQIISPETRAPEVKFRSARARLIPYIEMSFNRPLPVTRIICGPTAEKDVTARSIRFFLEAHGYNVPVESSTVPFRP